MACEECNVWQHSSCLGVSQAEAEKEDFHFVCSDCKRKMEDARKPKIPPLKFKVGSSSSPPSEKSTIYVNGDSQSKKRKSTESEESTIRLPPMKVFKPYFAPPVGNGVQGSSIQHSDKSNHMHRSFMNGPTLAPQGQLPSPQGVNGDRAPPPGLASPTRLASYSNGSHQNHLSNASNLDQFGTSLANGTGPSSNGLLEAARSSGQSSASSSQGLQHEKIQTCSSTGSQDPFHNSFDRQRPVSSHSPGDIFPPLGDRSSISSPQRNVNTGASSFSPSPTKAPNGGLSPHSVSATHPFAYAPQRILQSPSPATPLTSSSSPLIPPPIPHSGMTVSGLSPSKNSPPRPFANHGISGTPIMPPAAHLFPSPQVQNLHAPVKGMTPEQPKMVNGQVNGEQQLLR